MTKEFDGMFELTASNINAYCACFSNEEGNYMSGEWHIYSNQPTGKIELLTSIGKLEQFGRGSIDAFMGLHTLYISESGWSDVESDEEGEPILYALDLTGILKWKINLENMNIGHIVEVPNKYILVVSGNWDDEYLYKLNLSGEIIWKLNLESRIEKPLIDDEDNIYIKHGSLISKFTNDGQLIWNIELAWSGGCHWDKIVSGSNYLYYGYQYRDNNFIIEFDINGKLINRIEVPCYTFNPIIDHLNEMLYFIMDSNIIVQFDMQKNKIIRQEMLKKSVHSKPLIFNNHLILCYEKQVIIYTLDLKHVSNYRLKGSVLGTNIIQDSVLEILVSDYQSWDKGKSEICFSRLYELTIKR